MRGQPGNQYTRLQYLRSYLSSACIYHQGDGRKLSAWYSELGRNFDRDELEKYLASAIYNGLLDKGWPWENEKQS